MRPIRDTFLDFQLTTLFDKNISVRFGDQPVQAKPHMLIRSILSQSGLDMLFAQAKTLY
jgi:hypothetical protein